MIMQESTDTIIHGQALRCTSVHLLFYILMLSLPHSLTSLKKSHNIKGRDSDFCSISVSPLYPRCFPLKKQNEFSMNTVNFQNI